MKLIEFPRTAALRARDSGTALACTKRNNHNYRRPVTTSATMWWFLVCPRLHARLRTARDASTIVLLPYLTKYAFVSYCIPMTYMHGYRKVHPRWQGRQHTLAHGSCTHMHAKSSKHTIRAGSSSLIALANDTHSRKRTIAITSTPPTWTSSINQTINQSINQSLVIARFGLVHANLATRIGLEHDPGILLARFDVLAVHFLLFGQNVFDLALHEAW